MGVALPVINSGSPDIKLLEEAYAALAMEEQNQAGNGIRMGYKDVEDLAMGQ